MTVPNHRREHLIATRKDDIVLEGRSDVHVRLIENGYDDEQFELHAIAVDAITKRHLPGAKYKDRTVRDPAQLDNARKSIIDSVRKSLAPAPKKRSTYHMVNDGSVATRFDAAFNYISVHDIPIPGWDTSTRKQGLTWFKRHFLPLLNTAFTRDSVTMITGIDVTKWKTRELTAISNSKRRKTDVTVARTMTMHFAQVAKIYDEMRRIDPTLPELDPSEFSLHKSRAVELEQCKSYPEDVKQAFWRMIETAVKTAPRHAFGAIVLSSCASRTAEAAGTQPTDVQLFPDWSVVSILRQETSGDLNAKLKTDNAYRIISLPKWPTEMLRYCITNIGSYDEHEPLLTADELSDWVLARLTECGLSKQLLDDMMKAENLFPDAGSRDMITYDPASYVWRRDRTSILRNICGFDSTEIDSGIGHKIQTKSKNAQADLKLVEEQRKLAFKQERYVYSEDPELTCNPAYSPIPLNGNDTIEMIPFRKVRMRNESGKPLLVRLDAVAAEPGEVIRLTTPRACEHITHRSARQQIKDRLIIGDNTLSSKYHN